MEKTSNNPKDELINIFTESPHTVMRKCIEHKKLGWELLRGWDDNSKHNLQVNKELIESLFQRIEQALSESYQRYDSMFSFFDNFTLQMKGGLELSEKISLFKIQRAPNSSEISENQKGGEYYLAMESFNKSVLDFQKKLKETSENVQLEVNKKILSDQIRPFENNIKALYVKIEILKKSLAKRATKTTDKLKSFTKVFTESINLQVKNKRVKKSVFDSANEFVQSVKYIDISLTDFGLLLIALWEQCKVLELKRIVSISTSVEKFSELMNKIFVSDLNNLFIESSKKLKNLKPNVISENVFEYSRFMRPSEKQLIKSRIQKNKEEEQDLGHLKKFFLKPSQSMQDHQINYFLISKWRALQGKGKRNPKTIFIYLSVDFFYSVYTEERTKDRGNEFKLHFSVPIEKCDVFAKREKAEIVMTYTEKGMLWNSKKSVYLKMSNEEVEQFLKYYQRARLLIDEKERNKQEAIWNSQIALNLETEEKDAKKEEDTNTDTDIDIDKELNEKKEDSIKDSDLKEENNDNVNPEDNKSSSDVKD